MAISKVLVVRNDKIGDLVLTFPAIKSLKLSCPDIEISLLISGYTKDLADIFPYVDNVIVDSPKRSASELLAIIKPYRFDAVISMFSSFHVALAVFRAGIKIRIAPATKVFQYFYNHRINQQRSLSLKPEFEYNKDLVRYFLRKIMETRVAKAKHPFMKMAPSERKARRALFLTKYKLPENAHIIFIHPGSGGSAKNLSKQQYITLAKHMREGEGFILLTAGPDELEIISEISSELKMTRHATYHCTEGLASFVEMISIADCFVGGSTGPLHIAGALNVKTVGFYPNRQSATSLRWQTINDHENLISFSPPGNADPEDMEAIDVIECAKFVKGQWPELFE